MDKLSGLASKFGGSSHSQGANQNAAQGNQQEDYLDKAVDSAERRYGGGNVDPTKMRSTNEKITDTAREQFEKMTGKHVPEKFSN